MPILQIKGHNTLLFFINMTGFIGLNFLLSVPGWNLKYSIAFGEKKKFITKPSFQN